MPAIADRESDHPLWDFATRVLIVIAIAAAVFLLWRIRHTALLAFAAVIVAVLLLALASLFRRFLPIGNRAALAAAVVLVVVVLASLGWLMGSQVRAQFSELLQQLPQGIQEIEERLGIPLIGGEQQGAGQDGAGPPGVPSQSGQQGLVATNASRLFSWAGTAADAVVSLVLVLIAGVFLAAEPRLYQQGTARLFPPRQHGLVIETMSDMGGALRLWLIGKLISMVIIGVLVGLGTWLIGLPAPIALGVFAGLTEFVAVVGPIIGAIPALILAATQGGTAILWTLLLFLAIQQLESNVIAPLVQQRMVSLPPALFVLAIAAFGALFGILGVIVAAPLLVAVYVAVQKLWIGEALHEKPSLPGDGS